MSYQATAAEQGNEIIQVMQYRARMYGFLARMFEREVDQDYLGKLRVMHYPQSSENPLINDGFHTLYSFMRNARENVIDVLAIDYARAFLGSGILNGNAAFPYESVYTSEHALIMQDARDQVLATYRMHAVALPDGWTDPEDHIALELDFQRRLCERTILAINEGDHNLARKLIEAQYAFLELHLLNWVPNFCTDVERFASTDFYKATAGLARAFLADDEALLEDIAQASGIDLHAAIATARAADEAVSAEMAEEAAKDHLEPNVVIMPDDTVSPLEPRLAMED